MSQQLQSASLILSPASALIRSTNSDLEDMRDNEESFKLIYINATDFAKKFDAKNIPNSDSSDENHPSTSISVLARARNFEQIERLFRRLPSSSPKNLVWQSRDIIQKLYLHTCFVKG